MSIKRVFVYEYLTGGGAAEAGEALLPAGRAMRDAMAADLLRGGDWAVSVAATLQAGALPRSPWREAAAVAPATGEAAHDFIAAQAARHDVAWVVAPETGGVLASLQRVVGAARWLGCSGAAIDLATSKRATLLRLAGRGVLTPLAFDHTGGATRWVVKPDDGAGAVATRVHARRDAAWADAARQTRAGAAMTVEPWVEGEAASLSLLCKRGTAELLSVNLQRIAVDAAGELGYEGVDIAAWPLDGERGRPLKALAATVARAIPGLHGFVGIDFVWHPQRGPVVVEVNPRVTCAYVGLSQALGRNLAAELLAAHGEEPADAFA